MSDVNILQQWSEDLLQEVNSALATTVGGAIERAFVTFALPVLDCCDQLTVDVRGVAQETTTPQNPIAIGGHRVAANTLWLAQMFVTIARCVPVVEEGQLPDPALQQEAAQVLNQDLQAIWNWLVKVVGDGGIFEAPCMAVYLDPPTPLAASGGCGGWVFPVRPAVQGYDLG